MMTVLLRPVLVGLIATSLLLTTSCTTLKRSVGDSSLDYNKTRKLDPVALPVEAKTLPFTPLYSVPTSGENTLQLQEKKSKRFELPPPVSTIK